MKTRRILTTLAVGLGLVVALLGLLGRETSGRAQAAVNNDSNGNAPLAPAVASQGQAQSLSNPVSVNSITIDENREGWEQAESYNPSDPPDDNGGIGNVDWITVTMAHNCGNLYIRYEVNDGPSIISSGARYNLLMDVDRNRDTGYRGPGQSFSIGADVLVQGATVFTFTGASQEDWNWSIIHGYSVDDRELSDSKRDIEYRVPISDLDVFGDGVTSFDWVAWADHTWGGSPIDISDCDFYPDGGYGGETGDFNTYTFDRVFSNPERGFFRQMNTHDPYGDKTLAAYQLLATHPGTATLQCYREFDGITLIHRNFWLSEFVTSTISAEYLANMQADFDTVRAAGAKMIVRFAYTAAYTDPITCAGGSDLYDASKEWILTHTQQLSDVLRANSDVIAAVQAGFIGGWGEWSGSCHFACDIDWDNCGKVLFAVLDMLPNDRMVQVRTPRHKYNIFGTVTYSNGIPYSIPLDENQAHDGSNLARTAYHNDCFLCSPTDAGTYVYTPTEYPYLQQETKYVVMGGETGDFNQISGYDPNRLECETALEELEWFHWSFLSIDWYSGTHKIWRDGGCFDEIERKLGYRFVLLDLDSSEQITVGRSLTLSLHIRNEGYAAPYNPRAIELVLSRTNGLTHTFELYNPSDRIESLKDPRFWLAGGTYTPSYTSTIPLTLPAGSYEIFLHLPDPELPHRPEYAIRLVGCPWEPSTGFNSLNRSVTVVSHNIYLPVVLKNKMMSAETAYFKVGFPPDDVTFTIMLTDTVKMQEARDIVNGVQTDKVSVWGAIIKAPAFYNPHWSYHLDSASIEFFEFAIEVCDAHPQYVEEHLEEVCGALLPGCVWCPWSSVVMEEVHIPKQHLLNK